MCRSLRRCGVRGGDVEDLAHDVFLAAHSGFHSFDRARPIKPWLFGIVFRVASHYRRRAGHQREESGQDLEAFDPAPLADDLMVSAQNRALVLEALDTMELDKRAIFVGHDLDEQPMRELAHALGVPLFTAYSRLRVARSSLLLR